MNMNPDICQICRNFADLAPVQRIMKIDGSSLWACPKCRRQIYLELALGQFFTAERVQHYTRRIIDSVYLPQPIIELLKYNRLLQHAIQSEFYESAQSYQSNINYLEEKYGISRFYEKLSAAQKNSIQTLLLLEDYLISAEELGPELNHFPTLKLFLAEGKRIAARIKAEMEHHLEMNVQKWALYQNLGDMQSKVESAIRQVLIDLKEKLRDGEASWQQLVQILPKPVPPLLLAFLNDEITELPKDFLKRSDYLN